MKKKQGFSTLTSAHRSEISAKGGKKIGENIEHMAYIGRLGGIKSGEARRKKKLERDGLSK